MNEIAAKNGHQDEIIVEMQKLKERAVIEAQEQIAAICKRYGVRLVAETIIVDSQIHQNIKIVSD